MNWLSDFDSASFMANLATLVSTWGLRAVGALAFFIVGRWIAKAVRSSVKKALAKTSLDRSLQGFLSQLTYWAAFTFVVLGVLGIFGIPTTSFIAVLGAAGLAVGLALQSSLGNFAAGVMLLGFRPFRIGDYIEAGGTAGSVEQIGIFATTLNTPDNVKVIVPNGAIWGGTIKNYSTNAHRRIDLVMGVSYDDDLAVAVDTINRVLAADTRVLKDPPVAVAVAELADSSVNIVVRPWCKAGDYWDLRCDLTRRLKESLDEAGCSIPYPQQDVHFDANLQVLSKLGLKVPSLGSQPRS